MFKFGVHKYAVVALRSPHTLRFLFYFLTIFTIYKTESNFKPITKQYFMTAVFLWTTMKKIMRMVANYGRILKPVAK